MHLYTNDAHHGRERLGDTAISFDTFNNPGAPPPERGSRAAVTFAPDDLLVLEEAPAG